MTATSAPVAPLPFMPRGLSRTEAARYIGVGASLFDEMVRDHRMPPPRRINARVVWDRTELDSFFDALPIEGAKDEDPFAFMNE